LERSAKLVFQQLSSFQFVQMCWSQEWAMLEFRNKNKRRDLLLLLYFISSVYSYVMMRHKTPTGRNIEPITFLHNIWYIIFGFTMELNAYFICPYLMATFKLSKFSCCLRSKISTKFWLLKTTHKCEHNALTITCVSCF
jgi:hypothetical protein